MYRMPVVPLKTKSRDNTFPFCIRRKRGRRQRSIIPELGFPQLNQVVKTSLITFRMVMSPLMYRRSLIERVEMVLSMVLLVMIVGWRSQVNPSSSQGTACVQP